MYLIVYHGRRELDCQQARVFCSSSSPHVNGHHHEPVAKQNGSVQAAAKDAADSDFAHANLCHTAARHFQGDALRAGLAALGVLQALQRVGLTSASRHSRVWKLRRAEFV